jgi:hypothetical protein
MPRRSLKSAQCIEGQMGFAHAQTQKFLMADPTIDRLCRLDPLIKYGHRRGWPSPKC